MSANKQWLPHIINSIPEDLRGYSLSSYCIILEAWRRGIQVKFINKNRRKSEVLYCLSYKGNEHQFTVAKGDLVTNEALKICRDKNLSKTYLLKNNVPVSEGKHFNKYVSDDDIIAYPGSISYPVVLKPASGTGGNGVISNIKNIHEFKEALNYVRYSLNYKELIVEKFIKGQDYRLYVINDEVVGGIKRLPANVVGDGKSSIKKLLEQKQKERNKNPSLVGRPIKIDQELHNMLKFNDYTFDTIPEEGQRVFLKSKNNVSAGGDSVDITDELTSEIKEIAINAGKAIPGLPHFGADLIVDESNNTGAVIELNSMPHITAQLFPWKGKARDIPKAVIDYYFPETQSNYSEPTFYFDFNSVWNLLKDGTVKEYVLPNFPSGEIASTRFLVSGVVQEVNYGKWIQRQALKLDLNGYIKHLESGDASIVVSGKLQNSELFRDIIKNQSPKDAEVSLITEKKRKFPVKIGFEIINIEVDKVQVDGYYPVRIRGIKTHLNNGKSLQKKQKMKKTDIKNKNIKSNEKIDYKKEYYNIINSTSWRITKPIRLIKGKIKSKK